MVTVPYPASGVVMQADVGRDPQIHVAGRDCMHERMGCGGPTMMGVQAEHYLRALLPQLIPRWRTWAQAR
jgi:hypothetical protein